ncbi:MAG TPA: MMPL family transporter [Bradyrhizobium sp.]|nr:MMPL family transporter [Bradyrhizobium sp.]
MRIVDFCVRHRWSLIAAGMLLASTATAYDFARFSINTDIESLISEKLPWHQRQIALSNAFPQKGISIVVTAPTPENVDRATAALASALSKQKDLFPSIVQADGGDFFERNGLLFKSLPEVRNSLAGLSRAEPFIAGLASDPTLRGVARSLSLVAKGVQAGNIQLEQLVWPLSLAEGTLKEVLSGGTGQFSWQELLSGRPLQAGSLRRFIEVQPRLDFSALQPGHAATEGIRRTAADLKLGDRYGANVALTGPVPMNDDQFSVIRQSAFRDTSLAVLGVLLILWLALRSWKLILAVVFSLTVGLAVTAALGLAMVGAFNLISIAFFVLFVGLGVDFGIQFSVRYRSERHEQDDLRKALRSTARKAGVPLALAAAATAIGFFSFLPTSYQGLSELGMIAGCGMLIAFLCSITLVPAMLAALNPPGEPASVGFAGLAPLDDFLQRHRAAVIVGTFIAVLAAAPLLFQLSFDFDPVNLQNPASASVKTYRKLQNTVEASGNDAEILLPSLNQADTLAKRLESLPEVSRTLTLSNFIPRDQDAKMAAIRTAAHGLDAAVSPPQRQPAPSDDELIASIRASAADLSKAADSRTGPGADAAHNVSALLERLAGSDVSTRGRASAAFIPPLVHDLDLLRKSLEPQQVTIATLPGDLVRDWMLPDGGARLEVLPKAGGGNTSAPRQFASAVLAAAPSATGPAITLYESGKAVMNAFTEAGVLALGAIAILLFIALRRVVDVLLTLVPLVLAGAVTLEVCALAGIELNFANVVALPLLLGVGVAFKIYYITAWRAGKTGLLQSTLTRAVVFSAMTNAAAFGSMWSSSYPGMSSMGKLMALALLCTMAAAVLFQPVLMGQPRQTQGRALRRPIAPIPAE